MITAQDAIRLMPSQRKDTILKEIEEYIIKASSEDKFFVALPDGFFGKGQEYEVMYNAKKSELYAFAESELRNNGFIMEPKMPKTTHPTIKPTIYFVISWKNE